MNQIPPFSAAKEKILCIQLKQIGDVLMTTPSVRVLAKTKPKAEIHFLTQVPSNQIFEFSPYLSKIILYPAQSKPNEILALVKQIRNEHYAIVIDFLGLPKTAVLSWLTGAPLRIGFNKRGRSRFYTHPVDVPADVSYSALQKTHLLSALQVSSNDSKIDFFIHERDRLAAREIFRRIGVAPGKPVISVSPVSRQKYKVWPAENFAHICDLLIEKYSAQILFLWGPHEFHFIKGVRDRMRHQSLPDYEVPTIRETVALLEQVDLHVGNDNGPMHFAITAGIPTMAIFGRPFLRNWTPPASIKHVGIEYDPGCKKSCHYPKCQMECIKNLKTDSVMEKIIWQMDKILAGKLGREVG